ncbi:MAG TPA: hypothetical protein PKN33_01225 [Phycisphaerae bacterium]|nr:hypothetical protein [Phycisphaerae bacterium]
MKRNNQKRNALIAVVLTAWLATGCAEIDPSKRVVFLDGASYFGAGPSVKSGLRNAGYDGEFRGFVWTSFLLWGADHLIAARSTLNAKNLAGYIERYYRDQPDGELTLMGLSAGSAVILNALERLPENMMVENVVLFQPSVSASHNLTPALLHVRGKLYATCSRRDAILATLGVNADGESGAPAGRSGFRIASGLTTKQRQLYTKVVNLPWRRQYNKYGWRGGHVTSTSRKFVKHIIAPRVMEPSKPTPPRRFPIPGTERDDLDDRDNAIEHDGVNRDDQYESNDDAQTAK